MDTNARYYGSYLHLDKVLDAQHPVSFEKGNEPAHDEMLFIVNSLVQNSNSLLEDLRRLNQLKDIQSQSDISSKKEDKPNNITAQPLKKVVKLKGQT